MRKLLLLTFLLTAAFGFGLTYGCASAPPTLSSTGKTAFTADAAVVRVNELMNAAIQAHGAGALDTPTTRIIVTFVVDADTVLAKTPSGWQATVKAAWAAAKPKITTTNSTLILAIAAADAAIGGLQ